MLSRRTSIAGILSVLLVVATASVAYNAPRVQDSLRARIVASLRNANVALPEITVMGRDVSISGVAGSREVGPDAVSAIRGTWGVRDVRVSYREGPPVLPEFKPEELALELTDVVRRRVIEFDHGRDDLTPAGRSTLAEVLGVLARYPKVRIGVDVRVSAATDPNSTPDLARKRAEAVKIHLVSKGALPERFLEPRCSEPPTSGSEVLFFVEGVNPK
jgi:outer membrane protein OmpA-like peptidoglycan-associated protein